MYRLLLAAMLILALITTGSVKAAADAPAGDNAKPAGEKKAADVAARDVNGVDTVPVSIQYMPPAGLSGLDKALLGFISILLAIVIAQLMFLRSSVERMAGEKSLSNPGGSPMR